MLSTDSSFFLAPLVFFLGRIDSGGKAQKQRLDVPPARAASLSVQPKERSTAMSPCDSCLVPSRPGPRPLELLFFSTCGASRVPVRSQMIGSWGLVGHPYWVHMAPRDSRILGYIALQHTVQKGETF